MAFTGFSVRQDSNGVQWFRQVGEERWFYWMPSPETQNTWERVFGEPEWEQEQVS